MHPQIEQILNDDLTVIKSTLETEIPDQYTTKYKEVVKELAKIWLDPTNKKGYQYLDDVYWSIKKITGLGQANDAWHEATMSIGFLLDGTHTIYQTMEPEPEAEEYQPQKELYSYLMGALDME